MQFIFLLYHYFHAEEVYNSVRVMITCYVWMTGFGNFSFFYIKQDFGWLRVVQMLWRLNFSVILLMLIHNNTYILYYICPLHTFYFTMTYVVMYIWQSVNHSVWAIRVKLLIVGVVIYLVWDTSGTVFDTLFFWLGTDPVVGAKLGSVWGYPLVVAAVVMLGMFMWWYTNIYSMDKLEYNLHHSYFAFIPLTAYIFFRNITPTVRSGVSMSLHALGKTTLETYLLQHHVWLTSNAKTLLTLVPGMPWVNFALATIMFFYLSKELYRLTMSLRGMILPDNKDLAFRNGMGMIFVLGVFAAVAYVLQLFKASPMAVALVCLFLFLVTSLLIKRFGRGISSHDTFNAVWKKMFLFVIVLFFLGLIAEFTILRIGGSVVVESNRTVSPYYNSAMIKKCKNGLAAGHWEASSLCMTGKSANAAFCTTEDWVWDESSAACKFHHLSSGEASALFAKKRIVFAGDSAIRHTYHQFNHMLDMANEYHDDSAAKFHADMEFFHSKANISISFVWAPFVRNITSALQARGDADLYVLGASLWD
ncbi:RWA2, partial [Symbiodinium microadriaticum]